MKKWHLLTLFISMCFKNTDTFTIKFRTKKNTMRHLSRSLYIDYHSIKISLTVYPAFSRSYYFYLSFFFFFLAVPGLSCSMWDQVPWPGIEPWPPALGAQSLTLWVTREGPCDFFFFFNQKFISTTFKNRTMWTFMQKKVNR